MRRVEKVIAYVTWGDRLLVFDHAAFPEAGTQVPAGTIRPRELPEAAVLREAVEETGISSFSKVSLLGEADFDFSPFGRNEVHRRHFFHLPIEGPMPESWIHFETDVVGSPPIAFEFYWVAVADAAKLLIGEQGSFLDHVLSQTRKTPSQSNKVGSMKQPWQTIKSDRLVETKWLAVRQDQVKTHKGEMITYTFVEHPGAVFIVPVTPEGQIILLRQYRYTVADWCWEVPAGGMYENQDHREIAIKELHEEIGGTYEDLTYIGWFFLSNGLSNERGHVYLAEGVLPGDTTLDSTELLEMHTYGLDEAMRMARVGDISDGPSALALLMCEERIR